MESKRRDPFGRLGEPPDPPGWTRGDRWQPALDVFETEKTVVVRLELSGVKSGEVRVTVDGQKLLIRGERRPPPVAELSRLHQMEIAFGPFERTVRVAIPFERDQVAAHLEDGFLLVVLPKRIPARRRVPITAESRDE